MTPGTIIINMPLKKYLCKFLIKKYGTYHKVSIHSSLGIYLTDLLDKQYRKEHQVIKTQTCYPFHFPKTIVEKQGFDMSSLKMKKFELFVHKLFRSSLDDYITTSISSELIIYTDNNSYKQDVKKAMQQFLSCFDISEDDLKLDSLYRDYSREKKRIGQRI